MSANSEKLKLYLCFILVYKHIQSFLLYTSLKSFFAAKQNCKYIYQFYYPFDIFNPMGNQVFKFYGYPIKSYLEPIPKIDRIIACYNYY